MLAFFVEGHIILFPIITIITIIKVLEIAKDKWYDRLDKRN